MHAPFRRHVSRRAACLALVLGAASLPALADRGLLVLETDEFTLFSAADEARTRRLALRIAMLRAAVEQTFGASLSRRSQPVRIYALSHADWERHAQPRPGVSGYFLEHPFSSDLLFDSGTLQSTAYELVFHEYVHHLLRRLATTPLPPFLDEGFAEAFSTAMFHGEVVRLEPRLDHVRYLRKHEWLPFERLIAVSRGDPEYADHARASAFYAQAWATAYYALASDPASARRILSRYIELDGRPMRLHDVERLLGATGESIRRSIVELAGGRGRLPAIELRIGRPPAITVRAVRRLDKNASTLELAELMLRLGDRPQAAMRLFETALRRNPQDARARIGIGWARLQAGEQQQAAAIFDADFALETLSPPVAVALARGLFQLAAAEMRGPQEPDERQRRRLVRARDLFAGAIDHRATRLEAINGYVLASLALHQTPDSLLPLALGAFEEAPGSSELAVALAILHELAGRTNAARRYWEAAARSAHAGPVRRRILQQLGTDARDAQDRNDE